MTRTKRFSPRKLLLLLLFAPLSGTGCSPFAAPFSMGLLTPVPVPAWVPSRIEEKYNHKNDFRTAVLPAIRPGFPPPACEDPPDDGQILRALKPVARGVPYVYEEFREDVQIVTERIVDRIDPARFFPLVGWAQLHHCHYKCTVFFTETRQSEYPFGYYIKKPVVEVVYIDKDHLHLAPGGPDGNVSPSAFESVNRDLSGN